MKTHNSNQGKTSRGTAVVVTVLLGPGEYPHYAAVATSSVHFAYYTLPTSNSYSSFSLRQLHKKQTTMADTAVANETPAPATPAKKPKSTAGAAKKPKAKPTHPKTSEMVNNAIKELKERSGSSLQAIKKYIAAQYKVDAEKLAPFIRKYLKSAVESGALIQTKGKGASGSFKLESKSAAGKKPATGGKAASGKSAAAAKPKKAATAAAKSKKAAAASASPSKAKSTAAAAAATKDKKAAAAKKKPAAKKAAAPAKAKAAAPKAKKTAKPPTKKPKAPKPKKAAAAGKSKSAASKKASGAGKK